MFTSPAFIAELAATIIGIFIGTLSAFAIDRFNEKRHKQKRASTVLDSLKKELEENYATLKDAKPDYVTTPWGRSFI
ncbi:MAG: hypothetical protein ACLFQV_09525 [Vulcanimicrobiota bacterium]